MSRYYRNLFEMCSKLVLHLSLFVFEEEDDRDDHDDQKNVYPIHRYSPYLP